MRPKLRPSIGVELRYAYLEADKNIPSPPIDNTKSYLAVETLSKFSSNE